MPSSCFVIIASHFGNVCEVHYLSLFTAASVFNVAKRFNSRRLHQPDENSVVTRLDPTATPQHRLPRGAGMVRSKRIGDRERWPRTRPKLGLNVANDIFRQSNNTLDAKIGGDVAILLTGTVQNGMPSGRKVRRNRLPRSFERP